MKSTAKPGSGIYQIKNTVNGKRYIGKSRDLPQRAIRHRYLLNSGTHYNSHLQRSFTKNGADSFVFEVLEYCEEKSLPLREQYWIDSTDVENLYNSDLHVADKHNERNPFFGKSHTEETKKKLSEAKMGMYIGKDNPNYGNYWTEDQKNRMRGSKNVNAKQTESDVLAIADMIREGQNHQEIADQFKIARTVVSRISSGKRWAKVTGGFIVPIVCQLPP